MEDQDPKCRFSYNGTAWLEVGDEGLSFASVEHEPGWDFFELSAPPTPPAMIHLRRSFPMRLVRIYSHWPSGEVLATALHPAGAAAVQLSLPETFRRLGRWIVAVCPSGLACRPPQGSAAAQAILAAQAEVEAKDLEKRVSWLKLKVFLKEFGGLVHTQGGISWRWFQSKLLSSLFEGFL